MSGIKTITLKAIANLTAAAAKKINGGTKANAGKRLATLSSSGNKKDYRVDQGEVLDTEGKRYNAVLQLNNEGDSPGQKEFRKKHTSHAKLAIVEVDKTNGDVSAADLQAKFKTAFLAREASNSWS